MRRITEHQIEGTSLYFRVLAKTGILDNHSSYPDYSRKFVTPVDIKRLLNFVLRAKLESWNQDDGL